jgi:hypothetical protein
MLNCPVPHARGYLECLWEVGYKDGEALLGDDHDVALAAQYPNQDVPAFVSALADCGGPGCAGFIEKNADGRWMIHDLLENAPSYVQARMRMRRYRHDRHEQHRTNGEPFVTVAQPLRNCCASPAPAPAPAPMATDKEAPPTASPPGKPASVVSVVESDAIQPQSIPQPAEPPKAKRTKRQPIEDQPIPDCLNTPEFAKAWTDWQTHRRQIRKTLTPLAAQRQLTTLAEWGADRAVAAIQGSIQAGWTGIFENQRQSRTPSPAQHQAATAQHRQAADSEAQRRAAERQAAEAQRQRDEQEWAEWWGRQNQAEVEAAVWSAVDIPPARASRWRTMPPNDRYTNLGFREAARRYAPRQLAVEFAAA